MASKQSKTLLGAIVALILVATIVLVALGVSGYFSPCNKTPSAVNAEAVKEVLQAVEEAMAKVGVDKEFEGGVYIKVQEQFLGKDNKAIDSTDAEVAKMKDDEKKEIKMALQMVTVYGVKTKATKKTAVEVVKAIKDVKEQKDAVVVGKAVEFKDVTVDLVKDTLEDYPVLKQLLEKYQVTGHVEQKLFRDQAGKIGEVEGKERMYFKQIEKKA